MQNIKNLLDGYRAFFEAEYEKFPEKYEDLAKGQAPRIMVISCCDSRVSPSLVFNVGPGDIFIVRNVANLVPPYEEQGQYHGTSAALEFAVKGLDVDYIIVMGHSQCGGIKACLQACCEEHPAPSFINNWVAMVRETAQSVIKANPDAQADEIQTLTELAAVSASLENLMSFPFIREQVDQGRLKIYGAHLDIATGALSLKPYTEKDFQTIDVKARGRVFKTA